MCSSHIKIQIWINTIKMATTFSLCFFSVWPFAWKQYSNGMQRKEESLDFTVSTWKTFYIFSIRFIFTLRPHYPWKITLRDSWNKTTSKSWKLMANNFRHKFIFSHLFDGWNDDFAYLSTQFLDSTHLKFHNGENV